MTELSASPISSDAILGHLRALVAADSSDPASMVSPVHDAVVHCERTLSAAGFGVSIEDLGGGSVNILAIGGGAGPERSRRAVFSSTATSTR